MEKRLHLPGYYVEWNQSKKEIHHPENKINIQKKATLAMEVNHHTYSDVTLHSNQINAITASTTHEPLPLLPEEIIKIKSKATLAPIIITEKNNSYAAPHSDEKVNVAAIVGFALSIIGLSLIFFGYPFGILLLIASIISSAIALGKINKNGNKGKTLATIGLTISGLTILVFLFILLIFISLLG